MPGSYVLYTDGASRGNPGQAGVGAALYQVVDGDEVEVGTLSEAIGHTTNNVAEYQAVIAGLEMAARHRPDRLVVRSDSQLLVRQLDGSYKVRSEGLRPLHRQVRALAAAFPGLRFEHVPREKNRVADALANRALDE